MTSFAESMTLAQTRVVDPILTEHARGYSNPELVGHALFPVVNMPARGAKRIEFNREALRRVLTIRAPGTNIGRYTATYKGLPVNLTQDALQAVTPIEYLEDAQAVPGIDLQQESVDVVLAVIALSLEIQQAELARNPAAYADENKLALAGADKWSDDASNPADQVESAKEAIRKRTGRRPNTLLLSADARAAAKNHAKVRDHFKYTNSAAVSNAMLAEYFDVPTVVTGDAIYDLDDGTTVDVWGEDAVLAYVAPEGQRNMRLPSYGYTYRLRGHPFVEPVVWDNDIRSWKNNVIDEQSPEIVGSDAGFLFRGVV
ncbi:major capsid protein [Alteriqipengyuania flavescens]|uniref:major capsid protein n=1 Tax=Alteriqipengyuania flavescens TaxID=3053610 RepID=UPI0025B33BA3|nr:major capsid protein [Alteriqipengyuania flavescens]WJY18683.1 major capsid protein [Alteriqipengyuania flavescens]WJY24623.1 major capsid protein [Alteriqipengyuania flavescens]